MIDARRLTSLFFPSVLLLTLPAQVARPVIDSVTADSALTAVTINGTNFVAAQPRTVFLSGFSSPLGVVSASNTQIVASLPAGLPAGSYAVRVQGAGNGEFDEFFATFVSQSAGGSACTSYSNATATSTAFFADLSVQQGGAYAVSSRFSVTPNGAATVFCTLFRTSPSALLIDNVIANGTLSINVNLQGTDTVAGPATYEAKCVPAFGSTVTGQFTWRIQAICLQALVSPSP